MKRLLICFNFHPRQGSEEAVGWVFAKISAADARTVVYTQASYKEKISDSDESLYPDNLEVRYFEPKWLPTRMKSSIIPVSVYYKLWHWALANHLRKTISQEDYSLCHICTWVSAIHPVWGVFLPLPVVWGPLGGVAMPPFEFYRSHPLSWRFKEFLRLLSIKCAPFSAALKKAYRSCSEVLVAATDCKEWLLENGLVEESKLHVVPAITFPETLLDWTGGGDEDQALEERGKDSVHVVAAARLLPWKGLDLLIEALKHSGRPDLRISIYGKGPDHQRLQALIDNLGVGDRVTLRGLIPREQLLAELRGADLFALPSLHDSESGACMEAAGLGVPVLALNFGGVQSCLEGCRDADFLEGTTRMQVIEGLSKRLDSIEKRRNSEQDTSSCNLPPDSLLFFSNKKKAVSAIYRKIEQAHK